MNQNILLNDDFAFDSSKQAWCISGFVAGELISVYIKPNLLPQGFEPSQGFLFELEENIADCLADNEPNQNGELWLTEL